MRIAYAATVIDGGPSLFRLVRFWSRRWALLPDDEARRVQHIQVAEAVHGAGDGSATVGAVAHQLGLDQSGASRLVRDATTAGYVVRGESDHDRRRASLHLTTTGRRLLEDSHRWQRQAFEELTADWAAADRDRFAGYLQRLADQVTAG